MIHPAEMLVILYMLIVGVIAILKVAGLLIASWPGVMIIAFCVESGIFIAMAVLAWLLEVFDNE